MPNRKKIFIQPIQITSTPCPYPPPIPPKTEGAQIHFCTTYTASTSTDSTGSPSSIILATSGNNGPSFSLTGGSTFSPTAGNTYSFIMPYDATIQSVYMTVEAGNGIYNPDSTIYPFVGLATAPPESNTFTILSDTQTPVLTPFIQGSTIGQNIYYYGESTGLSVQITAGTRVAIICGFFTTSGTMNPSKALYYSGGIQLGFE